ncbi:MAG: hypothetical protein LBS60_04165 [Deltaproteobacteria bacterium]|jgi:hypothetical protein|nr:hypothetical protein [Deltaproteobacteria bacterium]
MRVILGIFCLFIMGLLTGQSGLLLAISRDDDDYDPENDPYFVDGFAQAFNTEKKGFREDGPGNHIDPALSKVVIREISRTDKSSCPVVKAVTTVYYPSGLSIKLDRLLAAEAKKLLDQTKSIFEPVINSDEDEDLGPDMEIYLEDCEGQIKSGSGRVFQARRTFDIYQPKKGIVSLLFINNIDTGGNHPSTSWETATYEVATARPLAIVDLFPKPKESLKELWPITIPKWCDKELNHNQTFPSSFYSEDVPCSYPDPPLPESWNTVKTFQEWGPVVLTKEGLFFHLDPYASWGYAGGPAYISVSKEDLLKIGAVNLWDETKDAPKDAPKGK